MRLLVVILLASLLPAAPAVAQQFQRGGFTNSTPAGRFLFPRLALRRELAGIQNLRSQNAFLQGLASRQAVLVQQPAVIFAQPQFGYLQQSSFVPQSSFQLQAPFVNLSIGRSSGFQSFSPQSFSGGCSGFFR